MSGKQIELMPCPSCGGDAELSVQYGDNWVKNIVHCDGVYSDEKAEYIKDPCDLQIAAYTGDRSVMSMYKQWNDLAKLNKA